MLEIGIFIVKGYDLLGTWAPEFQAISFVHRDIVESNDRPNVGSWVFDNKVKMHFSLFNNDDRGRVTSSPALITVTKESEL